MFQQPVFRENRTEVMQALMCAHPFATLVSAATGPLTADHVPLVLHETEGARGVLRGHLNAGNPLFRETDGRFEVLTIFQGPQAYVTPSWYASKREHEKVVPTWNYVVVHARGQLRFTRDTYWLLRHLQDLTTQHEGQRPKPWAVTDAAEDFVMRQLPGLVGFEIDIEDLAGTWKVSQNKAAADREGVEEGLGAQESADGQAVAALVRDRGRV